MGPFSDVSIRVRLFVLWLMDSRSLIKLNEFERKRKSRGKSNLCDSWEKARRWGSFGLARLALRALQAVETLEPVETLQDWLLASPQIARQILIRFSVCSSRI